MFVTDALLFYSKCRGQKKIIKFHRWKLSIFKQETYHRRLDFKTKNIRFLTTILQYKSQLVLRMSMFFSNEWAWLFYKNCVCSVISDAYSEPCQTSKMENFPKKVIFFSDYTSEYPQNKFIQSSSSRRINISFFFSTSNFTGCVSLSFKGNTEKEMKTYRGNLLSCIPIFQPHKYYEARDHKTLVKTSLWLLPHTFYRKTYL